MPAGDRAATFPRPILSLALLAALSAPGASASPPQEASTPLVATQEGDLPLILSAPHGGSKEIPGVPPRKGEGIKKGPSGFVTARDGGIEELAHEIAAAVLRRTGKKPYLVAASFHRRYLDCNRPASVAYEHDGAKAVYEEYHGALAKYCAAAVKKFGGGLVVDLHGQGSARDKVFRGTQNGRTTALMQERFGKEFHAGPRSLLGMLKARGWAVHPEDEGQEQSGFTGGYIVQTCGRREAGTDAIQFEFGADFRGAERRKATAETMAEALAEFVKLYTEGKRP